MTETDLLEQCITAWPNVVWRCASAGRATGTAARDHRIEVGPYPDGTVWGRITGLGDWWFFAHAPVAGEVCARLSSELIFRLAEIESEEQRFANEPLFAADAIVATLRDIWAGQKDLTHVLARMCRIYEDLRLGSVPDDDVSERARRHKRCRLGPGSQP